MSSHGGHCLGPVPGGSADGTVAATSVLSHPRPSQESGTLCFCAPDTESLNSARDDG
jgi:hypothetical protein